MVEDKSPDEPVAPPGSFKAASSGFLGWLAVGRAGCGLLLLLAALVVLLFGLATWGLSLAILHIWGDVVGFVITGVGPFVVAALLAILGIWFLRDSSIA
jgi:hypothetical protein